VDGFDQQLYSYVVPTVIAVWGMSTGAAGTIGTVTVVTSSFGGWFAGALADRFGRVRVLQIAILWVFGLHLPVRICPELRAAVHPCSAHRL
jgi:MFS family permease